MLFSSFESLGRTSIVGVLAYVGLVLFLRFSGKRTLAKMNAFDLVVTVALGSTLATILLSKDVSLADGLVAFAVLIGLQFVVTWTSVRVQWVQDAVRGEPSLLFYHGEFLVPALRQARVTQDEVRAAVRSAGLPRMEEVGAVVLETDGSFSVIKKAADLGTGSLEGVSRSRPPEVAPAGRKGSC